MPSSWRQPRPRDWSLRLFRFCLPRKPRGTASAPAFNRPRNVYEALRVAAQPSAVSQPLGENKRESIVRGLFGFPEPGSHQDVALDFSLGPWRLAEYFWPNGSGRMFPTHRRWLDLLPAEGRIWTPTLYMGLLPAILGIASLQFRGGSQRRRWLSWLALLATLGSFGIYGAGWLAREMYGALFGGDLPLDVGPAVGGVYWLMATLLPAYAYFRYPAKLLPLAALALSQLSAVGWDRACRQRSSWLDGGLVGLSVFSAAAALIVWWLGPGLFPETAPPNPSWGPLDRAGAHRDLFTAALHTALVALAAWWLLPKDRLHRPVQAQMATCTSDSRRPRDRRGQCLARCDRPR